MLFVKQPCYNEYVFKTLFHNILSNCPLLLLVCLPLCLSSPLSLSVEEELLLLALRDFQGTDNFREQQVGQQYKQKETILERN